MSPVATPSIGDRMMVPYIRIELPPSPPITAIEPDSATSVRKVRGTAAPRINESCLPGGIASTLVDVSKLSNGICTTQLGDLSAPTMPLGSGHRPTTAALPTFLRAAIRNPQRIGAISPSSPRLAALLASVVPTVGDPVVVELGPGTGAVTSAIAGRLPRDARHLAVELDSDMASFLRHRHTGVEVIHADAGDLVDVLAGLQISTVAAVVGGIPWSLLSSDSQEHILQQVADVIGSDGVFTTFAYAHARALPSARAFRRALEGTFAEVQVSRLVWQNFPPAFSYICRQAAGPS